MSCDRHCDCYARPGVPHLPGCPAGPPYASSQVPAPASSRVRKPYDAPRVIASAPARVGVAALLGAATAPYARPPGVPRCVPPAELAAWRELAAEAGPCADCDDPLCALARAILGWA